MRDNAKGIWLSTWSGNPYKKLIYDEFNYSWSKLPIEFNRLPKIKDVIFNNPATIVFWEDDTKTVVQLDKRYDDKYDPEHGLAMAICKKAMGNKGNFNDVFRKWVWENPRLENNNDL